MPQFKYIMYYGFYKNSKTKYFTLTLGHLYFTGNRDNKLYNLFKIVCFMN